MEKLQIDGNQQTLFSTEPQPSKWKKNNDKYRTWENQKAVTLPPKYRYLLSCFKTANETSTSAALRFMVRAYFETLPEEEKKRIIEIAKERG